MTEPPVQEAEDDDDDVMTPLDIGVEDMFIALGHAEPALPLADGADRAGRPS
jgi:hypothetical protein